DGGSPPGGLRRVSHGGGRAACACRGSGSLAEGGRTESGSLGDDRTAHRATCNVERATGVVARCLGGGSGARHRVGPLPSSTALHRPLPPGGAGLGGRPGRLRPGDERALAHPRGAARAAAARDRRARRAESGDHRRRDCGVPGCDGETRAVTGRVERGAGRMSATGDAHVRAIEATGPADLEVHVPRALTVWVTTTGADIDVVGVDGKLDLTSVAGAIHVVGTPQDVTAETMNGSVELAGGTGRARVKTVGGDILLRGASQDLGASTLSGRIVVRAAGWQRG